jgi:hypothetical protein
VEFGGISGKRPDLAKKNMLPAEEIMQDFGLCVNGKQESEERSTGDPCQSSRRVEGATPENCRV